MESSDLKRTAGDITTDNGKDAADYTPKKKKAKEDIAKGIKEIAHAMQQPVKVELIENRKHHTSPGFDIFDISERMAENVEKLMKVERYTISAIKEHKTGSDIDDEYMSQLEERLSHVRKRINKAFTFDENA